MLDTTRAQGWVQQKYPQLVMERLRAASPHTFGGAREEYDRREALAAPLPPLEDGERSDSNGCHKIAIQNEVERPQQGNRASKRTQILRNRSSKRFRDGKEIALFRPYFTYLIMTINLIAFLIAFGAGKWKFASISENPLLGPSLETLQKLGGKDTAKILAGEWWRLIVSIFLHSGFIHLLLSEVMVFQLGSTLEETVGFVTVAIVYFAGGILGNVWSAIFLPRTVTVGASGAIYGMVGALFADFALNHGFIPNKWAYFRNIAVATIVGIVLGLLPGVDNYTQLGGLIAGLLVGLVILQIVPSKVNAERTWRSTVLLLLAVFACIAYFGAAFGALYNDVDPREFCPKCSLIDCVESPWWDCVQKCYDPLTGAEVPC